MTYDEFIRTIQTHQTARVKCLPFPYCSAPEPIPAEFIPLLPEVINALDANIDTFCANDEVIVIIGLQLGPPMMRSRIPPQLNRFIHKAYPQQHFCCVLQYLIVKQEALPTTTSWAGAQTLVVDFTTGIIMDAQHYIFKVLGDKPEGVVYGQINEDSLAVAWQALADRNNPCPLAEHPSYDSKQKTSSTNNNRNPWF